MMTFDGIMTDVLPRPIPTIPLLNENVDVECSLSNELSYAFAQAEQ